jgi:hypothetical protein
MAHAETSFPPYSGGNQPAIVAVTQQLALLKKIQFSFYFSRACYKIFVLVNEIKALAVLLFHSALHSALDGQSAYLCHYKIPFPAISIKLLVCEISLLLIVPWPP